MDGCAVALPLRHVAARTPALLAGEGVGMVDVSGENLFDASHGGNIGPASRKQKGRSPKRARASLKRRRLQQSINLRSRGRHRFIFLAEVAESVPGENGKLWTARPNLYRPRITIASKLDVIAPVHRLHVRQRSRQAPNSSVVPSK